MLVPMLTGELAVFVVTAFWGFKRGHYGIVVLIGLIVAMLMTLAVYGDR
nr:hypothetical protein [Serratia proteamaculans]ULG12105.1 hypothetical protein D1p1_00073 [Serratia entomophila]ULG12381.1 hypothetical protein M3p_00085 [Serratia entomophila]ULG16030.1 hypothetical protein 591p_00180 [Serratia proteamaculans]ULG18416.1 hypothetical protein Man4p_00099 [Serratia proteamaculans]ULG19608.1 hypothetical protein S-prot-1p1_00023 [Serratia proteamaculans]